MAASLTTIFVAVTVVLFILSSDRRYLGAAGVGLPESPLSYHVVEECSSGTFVADLKNDAGLMTSRPSEPLEFRLLTNSTYFELDHSSGILRTSGRIDRDTLCPARDDCTLLADFVVKPIMYFRKVFQSNIFRTLRPNIILYEYNYPIAQPNARKGQKRHLVTLQFTSES